MGIKDIKSEGSFLNIYNEDGVKTGCIPNSGDKSYKILSDSIFLEKDSFNATYDEKGQLIKCEPSVICASGVIEEEKQRYTEAFNAQLGSICHFFRYKQLKPFVGKNYNIGHKKILVIGESHYLPPKTNHEVIKNWYDRSYKDLTKDEFNWTNTSCIMNNTDFREHPMYREINKSLIRAGLPDGILSVAYMNFFQRPSGRTKKSIQENEKDIEVANSVLKQTFVILQPDFIFFVSSKSYKHFNKSLFDPERTAHTSHPECPWWNKPSSSYTRPKGWTEPRITGKASFELFIKRNILGLN